MLPESSNRSSFLRSMKLVAWSFLGIRSSTGSREDLSKVNPVHVVLVGLIAALILVGGLIGLVKWVVGS